MTSKWAITFVAYSKIQTTAMLVHIDIDLRNAAQISRSNLTESYLKMNCRRWALIWEEFILFMEFTVRWVGVSAWKMSFREFIHLQVCRKFFVLIFDFSFSSINFIKYFYKWRSLVGVDLSENTFFCFQFHHQNKPANYNGFPSMRISLISIFDFKNKKTKMIERI